MRTRARRGRAFFFFARICAQTAAPAHTGDSTVPHQAQARETRECWEVYTRLRDGID